MTNLARFTIDGTPSSQGYYDVTVSDSLTVALEASSSLVWSVVWEVYSTASGAPKKTTGANDLVVTVGSVSGTSVYGVLPLGTATITGFPSVLGAHTWEIRCTVNGGTNQDGTVNPDYTFSRFIALRNARTLRKLLENERGEYNPTSYWRDVINDIIDQIVDFKIGIHLLTANTVGLWHLSSGTLQDYGPNNWPLTIGVGTERYGYFHPSLGGFYFDGATVLCLPDRHEELEITGAITIEMMVSFERVGTANWNVLFYSASGETEVTNVLYGFSITRSGAAPYLQIPHWLQEHDAGYNSETDFGNNFPFGPVTHLAFTRSADQLVTFYVNGRVWGVPTTLTAPTGGSSGRLCIGGSSTAAASGMVCTIASIHIQNVCLTADQVKADFNHTMGPCYGFI